MAGRGVVAEARVEAVPRMRRDALAPPTEFGGDPVIWAAWLYYEEGMTQEEIARQLGVSRGSVVNLLQEFTRFRNRHDLCCGAPFALGQFGATDFRAFWVARMSRHSR